MRFLIYGLVDPRSGEVRYIGKSTSGLLRPAKHWSKSDILRGRKTHKTRWIQSLIHVGLLPEIIVLERSGDATQLSALERFWIAKARGLGWHLTNATDGGEGTPGNRLSDETRALIRTAALGRTKSESTRAKLSEWGKGRPKTQEHRLRIAAALRGRKFSDTHRHNLSLSLHGKTANPAQSAALERGRSVGRTFSVESRLRMSASNKRWRMARDLDALALMQLCPV